MSLPITLILLLYLGAAGGAAGAEEAAGLRASASARIDAFTEHFRKTGDRQSRVPDLRTAVDELSRAHRDSAARSDAAGAAESLVRLGQIQRLVGNWKEALRLYEQALPLIQRAGDPGLLAQARTGMALAAMSLSDFGAAATHAADAVSAAERSTDARTRFDALDVLGQVQAARFDLNAAADTLNRALDVARKAENEKLLSFGYMDRAEVWLKRAEKCDFQRTFAPCRQALAQARADYAESRRLLTRLGYEGLGRAVDRFLAEVRQREQLVGAMESHDKTIRSAGMFEPSAPGDVLVTERYVNSGGQVPPVVQDFYGRMKAAQAEAGSFGDSTAARARYVEGLMAEMGGRQDEALAQYLNAVALLERDRGRLAGDKERGSFLEDKTGFYTAAVLQLLERRRHAEAFELMERLRARGMADLLASRSLGLAQGSERSLFGESVRLKSEIAARQSQLLDLAIGGNAVVPSRAKALGAEIAKLEDELAALDARIAREAPRLRQLTVAEPVVLARLQQTMREEGFEMLQYLVLEHAVILWHISHDTVHVRNVFLPRSALQEKAARLRKSLTDPNAAFDARAARQLYLYLVQPAKARLKARRVVIVPHDDLYYVPFQVLMEPDGRAFGEVQAISYVPSATVLMSLKRPASGPAGALFAAADPDLPAAPDEVKAVAKLYPDARVITDRLARKGEVRAALKGRDVVHLSVHGKFDAAEPLLSHLVFAAGDGNDGRLTAAEMFGLPLERARLVVLSACETGRSRADNAGDVQGMLRALLYAGAGSVVLSYWAVDSDATAAWMEAFHRAARGMHPAEAARGALAAVKSRKEYAHPYYWAAFMTVGR